jgi:hypothetical protein
MTLLTSIKTDIKHKSYQSFRVQLDDGALTTVHVAQYLRKLVHPRLVLFNTETNLLEWCQQNNVQDAISGGYFLREVSKPLGEMWINGKKQNTIPFISPWNHSRGSLYVSPIGGITIAPRYVLPPHPRQDLLQTGPLLVQNGRSTITEGQDIEGFSVGAHQFDEDITKGRFPRMAIATNRDYIFNISCDGYSEAEAGLSFSELADTIIKLGITEALNLDGGSSSTLIVDGELKNKPRSNANAYEEGKHYIEGRPIYSAIVFQSVDMQG